MPPITALVLTALASLPLAAVADCEAKSGPNTAALIELYTSEGCSSCPPADRRLNGLRLGETLVPLALHVGYWDDLGWRDPYAQAVFADRQSWLVGLGGARTVYTPQFFVNGASTRPAAVMREATRINARPARASVRLRASLSEDGRLTIEASARSTVEAATLYIAVAESGLGTEISAGENRGRRLRHDHVARAWIGPTPLKARRVIATHQLALESDWRPDRLEVSAFVQDPRSGDILQALGVGKCFTHQEVGS